MKYAPHLFWLAVALVVFYYALIVPQQPPLSDTIQNTHEEPTPTILPHDVKGSLERV